MVHSIRDRDFGERRKAMDEKTLLDTMICKYGHFYWSLSKVRTRAPPWKRTVYAYNMKGKPQIVIRTDVLGLAKQA